MSKTKLGQGEGQPAGRSKQKDGREAGGHQEKREEGKGGKGEKGKREEKEEGKKERKGGSRNTERRTR